MLVLWFFAEIQLWGVEWVRDEHRKSCEQKEKQIPYFPNSNCPASFKSLYLCIAAIVSWLRSNLEQRETGDGQVIQKKDVNKCKG